jgi:PAS domain S-box-containing protein
MDPDTILYHESTDEVRDYFISFSANCLCGFILLRVITDDSGDPADLEFILANEPLRIYISYQQELEGKKLTEAFPNIINSKFDWINVFGQICLFKGRAKFSIFSEKFEKWFSLSAYSPRKGFVVVLVEDITCTKKMEILLNQKNLEIEQLKDENRKQDFELASRNEELAGLNNDYLDKNKELNNSIDEKSLIHNKLIDSEAAARAIIDAASDIIILLNPDGTVFDCNESLYKNFNISKDQVVGQQIYKFFPTAVAKNRMDAVMRVLTSGQKETVHDIGEKGFYETVISPSFDKSGNVNKVVIIARNITDRFKVEQALIDSENRYRLLAENSEDIIWTYDLKSMKFSYISPAIYKVLGYSVEEAITKSPEETITPAYGDVANDLITQSIREFEMGDNSKQVIVFTVEQKCKDGTIKPFEVVSKLIPDENGKVVEFLGISRDITERRKIEFQLKTALEKAEESDKLKSAFLANMSHEIRTPMNGIIGFADLLADPEIPIDKRLKYAEIININGRHLLSIINDIIDLSKIESGQVTVSESPTNINHLFEMLVNFFKGSKLLKPEVQIRIKSKLDERDSNIFTDEIKLKQILTNLITNAIKFTEKGFVEFGCSTVMQEGNPFLLFVIADSGIGISKKDQALVFERFRQVDSSTSKRYGGTGLGLPISKAYIELLGGKVWIDSDVNLGAKFYFSIPLKRVNTNDNIQFETHLANMSDIDWANRMILIAEDEESNFFFLSEVLETTGAAIMHAQDGNEAVKLCEENKNIDVVLMDIKMPGLNGYEATKKIKKFRPDLPIIAQTAYAFSDDLQKAIAAGCDDYISKPVLKEFLIEKLSFIFDKAKKIDSVKHRKL